jgi:RNA polymerase sigma factor (sigma-70 family)
MTDSHFDLVQRNRDSDPSDADLVRQAQSGDISCLGLLLARHQADMRAVAIGLLGYGRDAEDALQDAALTALRRVSGIRDPHAAGAWLRAVVRNVCRMRLRTRTALPLREAQAWGPDVAPDPAELVDRNALRDWIWHAVEGLTPSLRLVTMLRYFTDVTSYTEIAAACGVPIGTVRSRLSRARTELADALLATADLAHGDATALTAARRRQGEDTMSRAHRGEFAAALAEHWSPQVEVIWPRGRRTGLDYLVRALERDIADGVRQQLVNVVASREVVIWEARLVNPPDDPFHCPPAVLWVQSLKAGRVRHLRLFHPRHDRATGEPRS